MFKSCIRELYYKSKYMFRSFFGFISDLKMLPYNFKRKDSNFALCVYYDFHKKNKWQVAGQYFLYDEIIREFDPVIISSKLSAFLFINNKKIFSAEPGFAAPRVTFPPGSSNGIFISDPWSKSKWLGAYYKKRNVNYIFTPYKSMFHKTTGLNFIGHEKVVSFPWSIPDHLVSSKVNVVDDKITVFGAVKNSGFYNLRSYLSKHQLVSKSYNYGGSENKAYSLGDYFSWLSKHSCCIAAISDDDYFSFPVAKYFEIPSVGSLLLAYECDELKDLGFIDGHNCVVFNKNNFEDIAISYKSSPESYIDIRLNGIKLVQERHTISRRIDFLKDFYS